MRSLAHTHRAALALLVWGALFVLGLPARAQEDFTYLYYFESDDANLSEVEAKEYAFATLRGERVTIVVYGLDRLVRPRLRVFNANGAQIGLGRTPPDQPYITYFQLNATGNDLFTFRVERADGPGGLARVMLFEGEPLNQDLTLLDDINPLLPSRAFMVAGRDTEEGLRVLVEVLDVPYYDLRPQVFASRGSLTELPDVSERFTPSDTFLWFNRGEQQVYFINIRPTPEESTIVTEDILIPTLNLGNFFYFDYYFTVGAGSDPIRLVTRQDCTNAPNRPECVLDSPTFGRTELPPLEPPPPPEEAAPTTIIIDREDLPAVQPCIDDNVGVNVSFLSSPVGVTYTGTACDDFIRGSNFSDGLAGGPGDDTIFGMGGDDFIFGDEGDDLLYGGLGNDSIEGGPGNDSLYGEAGNDTLRGGEGNDFLSGGSGNNIIDGGPGIDTVTYEDSPSGVTIDLSGHRTPAGGTAVGSDRNDTLFDIEVVIGSNFNDIIRGSADDDTLYGMDGDDYIEGLAGNDTLYGGDGNDTIYGGLGNDLVFGGDGDDLLVETDADGGSDTYYGGAGNDTFEMVLDGEDDWFYGESGYDVFRYTGSDPVVGIVGDNPVFFDGAGLDRLFSIEEVITGGGNDTLMLLGGGIQVLRTGAGDDSVTAWMSATTPFVFLEDGNDTFHVFQPTLLVNMTVDGGTGVNELHINNNDVNLPITVNANTISSLGDTYLNFASLTVTGFGSEVVSVVDDSFTGTIELGAGNDLLIVQLDSAANTYDGGAGNDTADYSALTGSLTLTLDTDTVIGNDTIRNFEVLILGNANYTITELAGNPFTTLTTGTGSDTITLQGDKVETLNTGAGDDSVVVEEFMTDTTINMGAGADSLTYNTGALNLLVAISGPLSGTVSDGAITDTFSGVELLTLADGDDTINVNAIAGGMVIDAGAGADLFNINPFSANVELLGGAGDDTFRVNFIGFSINVLMDGGAGDDLADYTLVSIPLTATLDSGAVTVNGAGLSHTLTAFETLLLGSGNDTVTVIDDTLLEVVRLGAGNDVLRVENDTAANIYDGGAGNDTADYSALTGSLTLVLDTDTTIGNDTIRNFEALVLGDADYTITEEGGNPFTTITTGSGADVVTLNGDRLTTLNTGAGNDSVMVTAFNTDTTINMGAGADSLTYNTGALNLLVAISGPLSGTVSDGAITDTFSGVELLTLADGDDAITVDVDAGEMVIDAGAGADVFTVGASASNVGLIGGAGDDTFVVTYASQSGLTLTGGTGTDTADYSANAVSLTVTVGGTTTVGTHNLEEIEVLLLGSGADVVTVADDSGMLEIVLGDGDDTLVVQVDSAANIYDGGAGVDTADYSAIGGNLTLVLDTDTTIGNDTIRNFEALVLGDADYTITREAGNPFDTITTGAGNSSVTINSFGSSDLTINMGAGADSLTYNTGALNLLVAISGPLSGTVSDGAITDTFSGVELLTLAEGDDDITIAATSSGVAVNSGAGDDTFNIAYNGSVVREFNAGTHAVADVAIYAGSSDYNVTIDANLITVVVGTGQEDRLTDFEILMLSDGDDSVTINNDTLPYTVHLGDGTNVVTLAAPTFTGGSTFNGGTGTDTFIVATSAGTVSTASLAGSTLTLNGTAAYTFNSIETVSIDKTTTGTITVDSPTGVTTLNTSAGSDTLVVTDSGSLTAINTGNGNDSIQVVNVNPATIINSGAGDDTFRITFDTNDNTFDGGAGVDVADYATDNPTTDFTVVVAASAGNEATVSNGINTDTLLNFETIVTGGGNDVFTINIDNIVGTWTFNAGGSTSGNRFVFVGTGTGTNTAQINLQTSSGGQDTLDFSGITGSGVNIDASNTASPQTFVTNTNITIWLQSVIQNIIGTEQNDIITGTNQNDVILGLGGNDIINGGAGNDTLIGGAGDDTINGGAGNDLIVGDHYAVGSGSQTVGAGGSDLLNGGGGNDTVIGGSLVDCQSAPASTGTAGADGADTIYGGLGADSIQGDNVIQNCTTAVDGGGGDDLIYGGANTNAGNDGDDTITGGPGADTIYGGNAVGDSNAGNDSINVAGDGSDDLVYGGNGGPGGNPGTNTINADAGDTTFNGNAP